MTDLSSEIGENAQGPAEARGDSGSMRQHSLRDQIEADRYLAAKTAVADPSKRTVGLRLVTFLPPGAC